MGVEKYADVSNPNHDDQLDIPSKLVFVNSMSELFHKAVLPEFAKKVFAVMNDNPQHVFTSYKETRSTIGLSIATFGPTILVELNVDHHRL